MIKMNDNILKVSKKIFKYYLIYHVIFDMYILGEFAYRYFSDIKYPWYYRIIDDPMILVIILTMGPIALIYQFINIIYWFLVEGI